MMLPFLAALPLLRITVRIYIIFAIVLIHPSAFLFSKPGK